MPFKLIQVGVLLFDYFKTYWRKEFIWLFAFTVFLLPGVLVNEVESGLDPSWHIGLELAIKNKFVFGKDICFTYGPLGFLYTKLAIAYSKWVVLIFEIFIIGLSVFILQKALYFSRYNWLVSCAISAVIFVLIPKELVFLIPPLFIVLLILYFETGSKLYLGLTLCLSILMFFIKVNYGFALLLLLYISLIIAVFLKLVKFWECAFAFLLHFVSIVALSYFLHVQLLEYLLASKHLIDSYNDAMVIFLDWRNTYLICAFIIILVLLSGSIFLLRKKFTTPLIALSLFLCLAYLFLIFKNGFVRADSHLVEFFRLCPFIGGIVYIFILKCESKIWGFISGLIVMISVICTLFLKSQSYQAPIQQKENARIKNDNVTPRRNYLAKVLKLHYFHQIFHNSSEIPFLRTANTYNTVLNQSILNIIKQEPIDVIPTEISLIHRYDLNYCPRPVIQSYSAYDLYLDSLNSKKYASSSAPRYILYQNTNIDRRMPFSDEPVTMRTLLAYYEVVREDTAFGNDNSENDMASKRKLLLLKHKRKPSVLKQIISENLVLKLNETYNIPRSANLKYLFANVEYSILGKIKRFLFQSPSLNVIIQYEDKTTRFFQGIPPLLEAGLLINKSVKNTDEAFLLFKHHGAENENIISITLASTEEYGFEKNIITRIEELGF